MRVIRIDGGLGRVAAMSGAITELAKKEDVSVITSRPIVFWGNPYIKSVHKTDEIDLFKNLIRGNDYFELEPYTDPKLYNDGMNWLEVAASQLGLDNVPDPVMFLAEHEKYSNKLEGKAVLFQPFGSTMKLNGEDKSYRSFKIEDAQYIADRLIEKGYIIYEVYKKGEQPELKNCVTCSGTNMRWIVSLAARYPVIGCDSCLHHIAKAFGKQAVVMWAATDAKRFGYDSNINLWENGMKEFVPMRLGTLSFNFDISNQYSNQFSKERLDKFVEICIDYLDKFYQNKIA